MEKIKFKLKTTLFIMNYNSFCVCVYMYLYMHTLDIYVYGDVVTYTLFCVYVCIYIYINKISKLHPGTRQGWTAALPSLSTPGLSAPPAHSSSCAGHTNPLQPCQVINPWPLTFIWPIRWATNTSYFCVVCFSFPPFPAPIFGQHLSLKPWLSRLSPEGRQFIGGNTRAHRDGLRTAAD